MRNIIIENLIRRISKKIISERKSDELSLNISRYIVNQFKEKEDFEFEGIYFHRGNEEASFDLFCEFVEDKNMDDPFSIDAGADAQVMEIKITYNPKYFPKAMNDLVVEIKETVEHELEHIEQQTFEDMELEKEEETEDEDYINYLTSKKEIPAYVRGLIRRSKTKKMTLSDTMDEWFKENIKNFENPTSDWKKVKKIWMDFAKEMREKEKVKKFK